MHYEVMHFLKRVKAIWPGYFIDKTVLECGSININGSPRELFTKCAYTGIDLQAGKGVDVVSKAHVFNGYDESKGEFFSHGPWDVVITCEMLEHDPWWDKSLRAFRDSLLTPGGLLIITCAGPLRREHGTSKVAPESSPALSATKDYRDYYHNMAYYEFERIMAPMQNFPDHAIEVRRDRQDLYFWGISKK